MLPIGLDSASEGLRRLVGGEGRGRQGRIGVEEQRGSPGGCRIGCVERRRSGLRGGGNDRCGSDRGSGPGLRVASLPGVRVAVPAALLEGPPRRLADPASRRPFPSGMGPGPEARLPGDPVSIGDILARHVEVIGARGRADRFLGPVGRRPGLSPVDPLALATAPEPRDASPALLIATPVAVDPETPGRGDMPGPGHPDEILAGLVPLPVPLDPLMIRARRMDARPFVDRTGGRLLDVLGDAGDRGRADHLMDGVPLARARRPHAAASRSRTSARGRRGSAGPGLSPPPRPVRRPVRVRRGATSRGRIVSSQSSRSLRSTS